MSTKIRRARSRWEVYVKWNADKVPTVRYTKAQEKELVIQRLWAGQRQVITFAIAYSELSDWLDKSFANCSELGFSDALFEMFTSGALIHTPKADYRLWSPRKFTSESVGRSN